MYISAIGCWIKGASSLCCCKSKQTHSRNQLSWRKFHTGQTPSAINENWLRERRLWLNVLAEEQLYFRVPEQEMERYAVENGMFFIWKPTCVLCPWPLAWRLATAVFPDLFGGAVTPQSHKVVQTNCLVYSDVDQQPQWAFLSKIEVFLSAFNQTPVWFICGVKEKQRK